MPYRMLIADDEPSVLLLLRTFFERQGYQVATARDGREAVVQAQHSMPDIIILDIQMPHKTGVEVVRELRTDPRFDQVPILALTAYVRDYLPSAVLSAGFDRMLTKPFEFAELIDLITRLLEQRAGGTS